MVRPEVLSLLFRLCVIKISAILGMMFSKMAKAWLIDP